MVLVGRVVDVTIVVVLVGTASDVVVVGPLVEVAVVVLAVVVTGGSPLASIPKRLVSPGLHYKVDRWFCRGRARLTV